MTDGSNNNWLTRGTSVEGGTDVPLPFVRVGRYLLKRRIGKGGMGSVYEAIQDQPSRTVAVKLMDQATLNPEQLKRFERESELLGRLNHPNIAEVYEAGTHREGNMSFPYYAMEMVDSATTITAFADTKKLSRDARIQLFITACRAVQHAHEQAVLHRDIKPSNLLVGSNGTLKLIDLGISRLLSDANVGITGQDQLLGTIPYMSPEQLATEPGSPSAAWDVYALGAVLYELLLGRLPVEVTDPNPGRLVNAMIHFAPAPPRQVDSTISKDLSVVMLKAIHKEPTNRYSSARELADELERILAGEPIRARADSVTYVATKRLAKTVGRHPLLSLIVALVSLALFSYYYLQNWVQQSGFDDWWVVQLTNRLNYLPDVPLQHVKIVAIKKDPTEAAKQLSIAGYDVRNLRSGRLLHAAMMRKLSDAGAKVIAFDLMIVAPSPFDDELVAAANEVRQRGTEVVFAVPDWVGTESPKIIEPLEKSHRYGAALGNLKSTSTWSVPAATVPDGEEGFFAQTVAAYRGFPVNNRARYGLGSTLQEFDREGKKVELLRTTLIADSAKGKSPKQLSPDQMFAQLYLDIPSDASLASLDFADVLLMPPAEVANLVRGKVVLIGDDRPKADGPFLHPDGRQLPGFISQAVAVETVLSDRTMQYLPSFMFGLPFADGATLYEALFTASALVLAWKTRTFRWRAGSLILLLFAACACPILSFVTCGKLLPVVEPILMTIACGLTAGVLRQLRS